MKTCEGHIDLIERVTRIEANTSLILANQQRAEETIARLEDRIYKSSGLINSTKGSISATTKIVTLGAAIGATCAAIFNLVLKYAI